MAAGVLHEPGTKWGPCAQACDHIDCAATRHQAETACGICDAPIGYDTRLYNDGEHGLVHAACIE